MYGTTMLGRSSSSSVERDLPFTENQPSVQRRSGKVKLSEKDSDITKAAKKASEMGCNSVRLNLRR